MTPRSERSAGRPGPLAAAAVGVALALTLGLAACGGTDPAAVGQPPAASSGSTVASPAPSDDAAPPAAVGRSARSNRVTFVPDRVVLPGGADAPVQPAATRDGELQVPEDVQHVGWWDGSAEAGDPFGNTVVAGDRKSVV